MPLEFSCKGHDIWKNCQSDCELPFFEVALFLSRACSKRKNCANDLYFIGSLGLVTHQTFFEKRLINMIISKYFIYIAFQNARIFWCLFLPSPKTRVLWIFKLPAKTQAHSKPCENCRSCSAWPVFYTCIKKVDCFLPQIWRVCLRFFPLSRFRFHKRNSLFSCSLFLCLFFFCNTD